MRARGRGARERSRPTPRSTHAARHGTAAHERTPVPSARSARPALRASRPRASRCSPAAAAAHRARAQDTPPRFLVGLKPRSVGGEGEKVKLAADMDSDMVKWVKAFTDLHRLAPKDEDGACARRVGGTGAASRRARP